MTNKFDLITDAALKEQILRCKEENVSNIVKSSPYIYRFSRYTHVIDMFENEQYILPSVLSWDDTYEGFLYQAREVRKITDTRSIEIGHAAFVENPFGQCWTVQDESDAFWRIYSQKENDGEYSGVRLMAPPLSFFHMLYDFANGKNFMQLSLFMDQISYYSKEDMQKLLSNDSVKERLKEIESDCSGKKHTWPFLQKRDAFQHEKEVRILYLGADEKKHIAPPEIERTGKEKKDMKLIFKDISKDELNSIFTNILFDPRDSAEFIERIEKKLRCAGFTGTIAKSNLYELPNITFYT